MIFGIREGLIQAVGAKGDGFELLMDILRLFTRQLQPESPIYHPAHGLGCLGAVGAAGVIKAVLDRDGRVVGKCWPKFLRFDGASLTDTG